jgi:hypothetical protein
MSVSWSLGPVGTVGQVLRCDNYATELLQKFGDFWGPGFYVMNFCSYLPDFTPFARIDVV